MRTAHRPWNIGSELRALKPAATSLLDAANNHSWIAIQPELLELIRLKIGALIGNEAGLTRRSLVAREQGLTETKIAQLDDYCESADFSALEKRCLAFAEMFVIDVGSLTEADVGTLRKYYSAEQCRAFAVALYITECTQRLEIVGQMLLGGSEDGHPITGGTANASSQAHDAHAQLEAALERYQEAVVQGNVLDIVVTELVRLRCARTHNCRICKTLRLANARAAGVDDDLTAKIDYYEKSDLDERIKTALRITDAFITRPDTLTEEVIRQARATFTREALAELCLDITKWSTQKIYVALGTDAADVLPKNEQGISFFDFDQNGRVTGFTAASQFETENVTTDALGVR